MHRKKATTKLEDAAELIVVMSKCLMVVLVGGICYTMLTTPQIWIGY